MFISHRKGSAICIGTHSLKLLLQSRQEYCGHDVAGTRNLRTTTASIQEFDKLTRGLTLA